MQDRLSLQSGDSIVLGLLSILVLRGLCSRTAPVWACSSKTPRQGVCPHRALALRGHGLNLKLQAAGGKERVGEGLTWHISNGKRNQPAHRLSCMQQTNASQLVTLSLQCG